jgi:peroxiredoxin
MLLKHRSFSLLAALALVAVALVPSALPALEPGDAAPDFTLKDELGNEHTLSELRGKVVVLEWTNPDCPYVQMHYNDNPTMKTLHAKYSEQGVVWMAVNSTHYNTAEASQQWMEKHGLKYHTLQDADGTVGRQYGAQTTPHMYIIDAEGKLAYMGGIDAGPRSEEKGAYVANALDEVIAGKPVSMAATKQYGCSVKYKD